MANVAERPSRRGCVRGMPGGERLRALLDGCGAGAAVAYRRGKISREHYASLIGCVPSALTRFGVIFAECEWEPGIAIGSMRCFSEMHEWLHEPRPRR